MQVGTKFVHNDYDAGGYKTFENVFKPIIQCIINVKFSWSQYFMESIFEEINFLG